MSDLSDYGGGEPHRVADESDGGEEDETPPDIDWTEVRSKTIGETTLINLRDIPREVRNDEDALDHHDIVRVDRPSKFGNPYRIEEDGGDYTREESVREYRLWFAHQVGNTEGFREDVEDLRGSRLGCWCIGEAPDAEIECHGEAILEFLDQSGEMG